MRSQHETERYDQVVNIPVILNFSLEALLSSVFSKYPHSNHELK
jgi:hypothetical protein